MQPDFKYIARLIDQCLTWRETPEGQSYWSNVCRLLQGQELTFPIPESTSGTMHQGVRNREKLEILYNIMPKNYQVYPGGSQKWEDVIRRITKKYYATRTTPKAEAKKTSRKQLLLLIKKGGGKSA